MVFFFVKKKRNLYYNLNKWGNFQVSLMLENDKKYAILLLYCNVLLLGNQFFWIFFEKCFEQKLLHYCCVVDDICAVDGIEMSVFERDIPKFVQEGKSM